MKKGRRRTGHGKTAKRNRTLPPQPVGSMNPKGIILPISEYERNEEFFKATGATFRPKTNDNLGYLAFPPGTKIWSCPRIEFPNGATAVVVIVGPTERRRVITELPP